MKKRSLLFILVSALALSSCNLSKKSTKVSSVKLSQETIEVEYDKTSSEVSVTVEGSGSFNKGVKLVSENESISKASYTAIESGQSFKVYGVGVGQTKINVISLGDETKAASLSVTVKASQSTGTSEIQSVSLDEETHLFTISDDPTQNDAPITVKVTINGKGDYDKTAKVTLAGDSVSVDKDQISSGESFTVSPIKAGEAQIKVTSNQDSRKYATLKVKVEKVTPQPPVDDEIYLSVSSKELFEGQTFNITATKESDKDIEWSWKEEDANNYVIFNGTPNNEGASVKALAITPEGKTATLVAKVGEETAECVFTVKAREHDYRTFYVTNNSYLGYEHMYLYMWNEEGDNNATWPGVELTETVTNAYEETCYVFEADVANFVGFLFNDGNGHQTDDCSFADFGTNNNVWFNGEGAHYAQIELDVPTIKFENNHVSVYATTSETFSFVCRKGDAEYSILSGESNVQVTAFANGSITIKGLAVGEAVIKVFIPGEGENLAEDTLYIEVLDPTNIKDVYFTNNKGWENVYIYTWGNESAENATWPGVKLENPLLNGYGEPVYLIHLDVTKWTGMILNNGAGAQSSDIEINEEFITAIQTTNNIYLDGDESPYEVGYATFSELEYEVAFAKEEITLYEGKNEKVNVDANAAGVTYNVTSGSDCVEILSSTDEYVFLKWLKAGEAVITANNHGATDTLNVHCSDEEAPVTGKTLYFTNNKGWEKVYLYTWSEAGNNTWPGEQLFDTLKNNYGETVYKFEIDTELWDKFIVNNGAGLQTRDISLDEEQFLVSDNIYLDGDSSPYNIGFATFSPFQENVEFATEEVDVYSTSDTTVEVSANASGVHYEVTEGAEFVEIKEPSDESITLHFLQVGNAEITATLGESVATLTVHAKEGELPADLRTIYVTNSLDWENVYLYTWKGAVNNTWPGEELKEPVKNNLNQDVYIIELDANKVEGFIINNGEGAQSPDIDINDENFETNDNIYFVQGEEGIEVGFANFEAWAEKVEFANEEVYVEEGTDLKVEVSSNASGVTYVVTDGQDVVSIVDPSDSEITLHFLKDGTATITASLGESTDTLLVTCTSAPLPVDLRTIYVTNNLNWEHVYLYSWKGANENAAWPGVELNETVKNNNGEDVYKIELDANRVEYFIINNGAGTQSPDILVKDENFKENDNIYFELGETIEVKFATFEPFVASVEFEEDEVTVDDTSDLIVKVNANVEGVVYEVTAGKDVVEIVAHSDSEITLHYLKEGNATISATCGELSDTLIVTCEHLPEELKTIYVTNNLNWEHVYLYSWKGANENAAWPGVELTDPIKNNNGEDVYVIELDANRVEGFIINNGAGVQSPNILVEDENFKENDNIYFELGETIEVKFATFVPFVESVEFANEEVTVNDFEDLTVNVTANAEGVEYEVTEGKDVVEIIAKSDSEITLHFLKEGTATITATLGEKTDTLAVTCAALPVDLKTIYITNSLEWEHIYLYSWKGSSNNHEWPGVELTDPIKNNLGQDVYLINLDANRVEYFIFNNGSDQAKSPNILVKDEHFATNDNVYLTDQGELGFATFEPFVESVEFANKEVTIDDIDDLQVGVNANAEGVEYEVTDGKDVVEIIAHSDSEITLHFLKEGTATITATLGEKSDTLAVTCVAIPVDLKTIYITNSQNWDHVYLYTWKGDRVNHEWPGVELNNPIKNSFGQNVYVVEIDANRFDSFIFNNGNGSQSPDILVKDEHFATSNNVYLTDQGEVGFATFAPFVESVEFANDEVSVEEYSYVNVSVNANAEGVVYTVIEGADVVEIIARSDSQITLHYLKEGSAVVKATLGESSDTLSVTCTPLPEDYKIIYFTNSLNWEHVYLYTWKGEVNNTWPGVELEDPIKNNLSENVYIVRVDVNHVDNIILNNGVEESPTISISDEHFASNDNIYLIKEGEEIKVGFATFEPFVESVEFKNDEVTVNDIENLKVEVTSNTSGVHYVVTQGADVVEIIAHSDTEITLHYLKAGSAVITATLGESSDTLLVTCEHIPEDIKTIYITNSQGWEHVYVYAWKGDHNNHEWPGVELTNPIKNNLGQNVYIVELDANRVEYFIFNNGSDQAKSPDISVKDEHFATNDNVYLTDQGELGFATFSPFVESVEFAKDAVTVDDLNDVNVGVSANAEGVAYEVTSGKDVVEIIAHSDTGITLHYLKAGSAVITATLGESTDTLNVTCAAIPQELKTIYITNSLGWENIYVYTWTAVSDNSWPGVELSSSIKNNLGQDVYVIELDFNRVLGFIINNGAGTQTIDISLSDEHFLTSDNVYLVNPEEAGNIQVGFATFEPFVASIEFEKEEVKVNDVDDLKAKVTANAEGVTYEVTSGKDVVEIIAKSDSEITLHFLKEGSAVITATLDDKSDTLLVTCEALPIDLKTIYVTNNEYWEHVYLYAWRGDANNHAWPGVELSSPIKNNLGQDVYVIELDANRVEYFIINNGNGSQTPDILVKDEHFASSNNIYYISNSEVGFATFLPFVESVEFANEEVTVEQGTDLKVNVTANTSGVTYTVTDGADVVEIIAQSDSQITLHYLKEGSATITATLGESSDTLLVTCTSVVNPVSKVMVTFTVHYQTSPGQDLYIAGINGWDVDNYVPMSWTEGHIWTVTVELTVGETYQFKLIVKQGSNVTWERSGDNRTYTPTESTTVALVWGNY